MIYNPLCEEGTNDFGIYKYTSSEKPKEIFCDRRR